MNFSADTQDPHTLIVDILNLIEHPLKKYPESKKGKQSHRTSVNLQYPSEGKSANVIASTNNSKFNTINDPNSATISSMNNT